MRGASCQDVMDGVFAWRVCLVPLAVPAPPVSQGSLSAGGLGPGAGTPALAGWRPDRLREAAATARPTALKYFYFAPSRFNFE